MTQEKRYIIRKYVKAPSAKEALEREPDIPVADVYIDDSAPKDERRADAIGFKYVPVRHLWEY